MWTRRNWTHAGLAAVAAFGLTVTGYWSLGATDKDATPPTTVINQPQLKVGDCIVKAQVVPTGDVKTVSFSATIQPGAVPQLQIDATNPGTTPATIEFKANLQIASVYDAMSRVERAPAPPVWQQSYTLTIPAGQTKSVTITTGAKINAASVASLNLFSGKDGVTALSLNTPIPQNPAPAKAAAAPATGKQVAVAQGQ